MKRNENLVLLSRDHHYGLLCVWKIRQGIKKNISPERIGDYLNYFWENHLKSHFEIEDEVLPDAGSAAEREEMEAQHTEIRRLIRQLQEKPSYEDLALFAEKLQEHIRFEERSVFPHYQEVLPEQQLAAIGEKISQLHGMQEDTYPDEFWK